MIEGLCREDYHNEDYEDIAHQQAAEFQAEQEADLAALNRTDLRGANGTVGKAHKLRVSEFSPSLALCGPHDNVNVAFTSRSSGAKASKRSIVSVFLSVCLGAVLCRRPYSDRAKHRIH